MNDETSKILRLNMKHYRNIAGITQKELAERCEISRFYIAEIETERKAPSLKTVIKIANALEVTVATLFTDPRTPR